MLDHAPLTRFLEDLLPPGLDLLRQMVGINSFTGNRAGVNRLGQFTAECFAPLGFEAESVPSTNPAWGDHLVLTRRGQGTRSIAMISHLDTVFPPEEEERNEFRWRPEGDRIYGPGTQDIKGGTLMMWLVLSALRATDPQLFEALTWRLLWNSSEEMFSPDFGDVCRRRFDPGTLAALVFEAEGRSGPTPREGTRPADPCRPGPLTRPHEPMTPLLVVARKGRATWRISVNGRGAHAGSKHHHGANAIVQLGATLGRVAALTDYDRHLTFNVGRVTGGTVLNRVPHEAVAEGELRCFTPVVFAEAKAALTALAGRGSVQSPADGFACEVRTEILTESRPWPRNPATDRLFATWAEAAVACGLEAKPQERGGLSDGNLIWDAVPTLDGLGPWGDNDHCSERSADGAKLPEYVSVSSFVPKAAWNCRAIQRLIERVER